MRRDIYQSFFEGKRVTVLGLGLLGRGTGDTLFLADHVKEVLCSDDRSEEKLRESILHVQKSGKENIYLQIGAHREEDFENRDFVLVCAGLPKDYPHVKHAEAHRIPVYMSAALISFLVMKYLPKVTIIGVTGTRGKSTTTMLIAHILETAGKKVHLGGNIRGLSNLPLLDKVEDGDFLVLELDSWQLQGFEKQSISPHIAVFTNFLDDHLNYYKHDKEAYFYDKASIYRYQKSGDVLIASEQARDEIHKRGEEVDMVVPIIRQYDSIIFGAHNEILISLASEVAVRVGIQQSVIEAAVKSFPAVEGRLEYVGDIRGIHIVNDNNATTPDALLAGVDAVRHKYRVKPILICGGKDKELDIRELETRLPNETKEIVCIAGNGTDRLEMDKKYVYEDLKECIEKAVSLGAEGDVILFSPGFASFSKYFNNEYERNDAFLKKVSELIEKNY